MGLAKNEKRSGGPGNSAIQQQISTMFGEKVKKPRMYMGSAIPKPGEKPGSTQAIDNVENRKSASTTPQVASQKRRWRLSELLKKERENRTKMPQSAPSFVFDAPHMDTRRPQHIRENGAPVAALPKSLEPPRKKAKLSPISVKYNVGNRISNSTSAHPSGGEALLHDRSLLPKSHALLLDVLQGLESAIALLRTRKTLATVSAVREIVSRSTHRTFTLRILSQLAHVVPEAVAVLPGIKRDPKLKRSSDNLIVRLDDCSSKSENTLDTSSEGISSALGDTRARIRRSLLHKRLLSHVRGHHEKFLEEKKVIRYAGNVWHPEFDPDTSVPELPAPPLYPIQLKSVNATASGKTNEQENKAKKDRGDVFESLTDRTDEEISEGSSDLGIPSTLLERVKARERERSRRSAVAEAERVTNHSLLTKLPCTMDTILSVLRSEGRSAVGWLQLITKLEKLHPKKWDRQDLESQLIAITDLATEWCKKVELKSSRGGYAFRIISPSQFAVARDKVSAVKCYPIKKD